MLVVHVHVQVKPEYVESFKQATLANARESVKEPGIARFDVVQQQDDSTRFVLVDGKRRMRGFYLSSDDDFPKRLLHDIRQLEAEKS